MAFIPFPSKISRQVRDGILALYPALAAHEKAATYRAMLEYFLFSPDRETATGRIIVRAETLAAVVGAKVGQAAWSAGNLLADFDRDVFPLDVAPFVACIAARTIRTTLPDELLAAATDASRPETTANELVWFRSGLPVTPTSRRKQAERYAANLHAHTDDIPENHPARDLLCWLNNQDQRCLGKRVRANWERLQAMFEAMPSDTPHEKARRVSVGYTLTTLSDHTQNLYRVSTRTPRIHTTGVTVHQLPSAMRKAALSGAVEVDIRSSQLAIVSKLWGIEGVGSFLQVRDYSIWQRLMTDLDVEATAKPLLKSALYAACFGMGKRNLKRLLADGDSGTCGIGKMRAGAFLKHDLIAELLAARQEQMARVRGDGGLYDAFGRWLSLEKNVTQHGLLAVQAQSWELWLMLPVFAAARRHERIVSILSWLHDSVVVWCSDRSKTERIISQMKQAFDENALHGGFATELEVMPL